MIIPEIKMSVSFHPKIKVSELTQIKSSSDSQKVLMSVFDDATFNWTEEMLMLCLNKSNRVLGYFKVSTGAMDATLADPRVVYTVALKSCAVSIILAHNHPSGNLTPSQQDIQMTKKMQDCGKLLGITLLDHMILTSEGYYSFADEGMM